MKFDAKCRDCGRVDHVDGRQFFRASGARCGACGGYMDKVGPATPQDRPESKRSRRQRWLKGTGKSGVPR